jgi:hypothetical protein
VKGKNVAIPNPTNPPHVLHGNSNAEKIDFLKKRIDDSLVRAKDNRQINRRKASYIKVVVTLFSATATILLGLQIANLDSLFKSIAFILTALVTTLSALEPFFNFRSLWVEHEIALWKFYRLRDKLEFYLAGISPEEANMDKINSFYNEFQSIWNDLSTSWVSYRKQDKS